MSISHQSQQKGFSEKLLQTKAVNHLRRLIVEMNLIVPEIVMIGADRRFGRHGLASGSINCAK